MSLITGMDLAKSFGPEDIFSKINLSVPHRARIAIVGPNGIGKTTLLRILAGEEQPTAGTVSSARNLRIGYLPQEAGFESTHMLWEECLLPFTALREQEAELARLEMAMADAQQAEQALERYGRLQAEYEHHGGYTYLHRIEQVLFGLGFSREEFVYPLPHLSGGQRTRALLVEWLEGHLSHWHGATLIVSHDRYFLDRVVNTIWEMTRAGFEVYHGNYSAYVRQRQERWERRKQLFVEEKTRLEKEVDYIRKNISGQNVSQARGRLRRLHRYLHAVEQLGLEAVIGKPWGTLSEEVSVTVSLMSVDEAQRRVRALKEPSNRPLQLHLRLLSEQRSGELVLRTHNLRVGYPGNVLFSAGDIELRRLECTALIGPNGAGKTTFLKTILEKIPPLEGEVELGASLQVGYFAQAHEDLHPDRTLVQEIDSVAPDMLLAEIRRYLARFLFTGDEVFKLVGVLSGGERGRLALAKLALGGANLLLLDEPTNHLDIPAQEILQEVLADFEGTILLVSHDRYLIDALATQIWEIDETQGKLRVFKGSYSLYRLELEAEREAGRTVVEATRTKGRSTTSRTRASADDRRRAKRLADLEKLIAGLENPPSDPAVVHKLGNDYVRVQNELDELLQEWDRIGDSALVGK
jgi:ATP-binding cassette subfamily F protein 3